MTTVALIGHNGLLGSRLLRSLVHAEAEGSIKLTVLHRETSSTTDIPEGIEKRVVRLDESGLEANRAALEGVEVVLSAVGNYGVPGQKLLIDALAGSPTIKTFAHSDFGCNWLPAEMETPTLKILGMKEDVIAHGKAKGVPVTTFRVGLFDDYFFLLKWLGTDIWDNKFLKFRNNLNKPCRISSLAYITYAVTQLVANPSQIADRIVQLYDCTPTGQEIIDVLTKVHGQPPLVEEYTEEQYEADMKDQSVAIMAGIRAKWADQTWGDQEKPQLTGWTDKSFEQLVRENLVK
ncbi:hypothetical protein IAU60_002138 [Kwoniella sp. DSM 27419]